MLRPVTVWHNRFEHQIIKVKSAYKLDALQLIIVYARDSLANQVSRRIVHGPCVYTPLANEWLHQFSWHTEDKDHSGHMVPNGAKFEILKIKPDFFNYNVKEVRTLDDTLITVRLMLIYELVDVELMLDKTQDPISDFINALCADVISLVSRQTFAEFLASGAHKLNELESYEQLMQRTSRAGYRIVSVLYNGYASPPALQDMQDEAIQLRTKLRLNAEIERQNNQLANLKLESENRRFALENELNRLRADSEQRLSESRAAFDLETRRAEHELELKTRAYEAECMGEVERKKNETDESFLKGLSDMSVDLNQYGCEMNRSKSKIDKIYEIVN